MIEEPRQKVKGKRVENVELRMIEEPRQKVKGKSLNFSKVPDVGFVMGNISEQVE